MEPSSAILFAISHATRIAQQSNIHRQSSGPWRNQNRHYHDHSVSVSWSVYTHSCARACAWCRLPDRIDPHSSDRSMLAGRVRRESMSNAHYVINFSAIWLDLSVRLPSFHGHVTSCLRNPGVLRWALSGQKRRSFAWNLQGVLNITGKRRDVRIGGLFAHYQ